MGNGSVDFAGAESRAPDLLDTRSPPDYPSARGLSSLADFRFTRPIQSNPDAGAAPLIARGYSQEFLGSFQTPKLPLLPGFLQLPIPLGPGLPADQAARRNRSRGASASGCNSW
jgi:hypothetical protein